MNNATQRRIKGLELSTQHKAIKFLGFADEWLKNNGFEKFTCEITSGRRSIYDQAGLYSLGRKWKYGDGWTVIDPKKIVTRTLESNHIDGFAFDIALVHDGKYHWPDPSIEKYRKMWVSLAHLGRDIGLYPGALWRTRKDYPHYSMRPG
jgi:hypothetical protein